MPPSSPVSLPPMTQENLLACPLCGAAEKTLWLNTQDYALTQEPFSIEVCGNCGLRFTNPRPTRDAIGPYYGFADYISHTDTSQGILSKVYHLARKFATAGKVRLINGLRENHPAQLLDYGCGTGFFAEAAQRAGWNVQAVEPDDGARKLATIRLGGDSRQVRANLDELPSGDGFSVITLWHVLEHVHQLNDTFGCLLKRLLPNGRLVVAVPNPDSADAQHYGAHWAALDVPRHLYHFTPAGIRQLAARHNASVEADQPMYLDAFYVSLLSERFAGGSAPVALWQGLRSNWRAVRTGQTSSRIYIIRRNGAA